MYTIIDLLNRAVTLKNNAYDIYKNISVTDNIDDNVKFAARILANQESKNVQACIELKEDLSKEELPGIDFDVYDKASNLISGFVYPDSSNISNINQLLNLALDFQKQSISLMISIQGFLIKEEKDRLSLTYKVLSEIIKEEQKRIDNIENFLR